MDLPTGCADCQEENEGMELVSSCQFYVFLQRVLFTQRNTFSMREKTSSDFPLGRNMGPPAVIKYSIGERVDFHAGRRFKSFLQEKT